jgi:hypothetical protein
MVSNISLPVHNNPLQEPIFSHFNPDRTITHSFFKANFTINISLTPWSLEWRLPFKFFMLFITAHSVSTLTQ